eukprot:GHUV01001791.1.p1 GENE.GHUV01001791.1~~GHUV01001791.1.p1  ORF type:complete len:387 (+),score=123.59 GHUV01001791.1:106-1266(+)
MACASPLHTVHDRFSDGDLHEMLDYFQHDKGYQVDDGLLPSSSDSEAGKPPGTCEQSGTSSPIASTARPASYALGPQVQRTLMPTGPQCGAFLVQASNGSYLLAMPPQPDYTAMQQAAMQQASARDSKQQTVSHSTIEKQRRDRINSLIDELRELVPSAATMKGPDGGDMKRPKHVVLSDTISLLKHLQQKSQQDEQELQQLRQQLAAAAAAAPPAATAAAGSADPAGSATGGSAQSLMQRSLSGGTSATAGASGTAACPELPQAPVNLPASVGVVVEEGTGCYLVKINCKDRRGLLSDITAALKGLPLQITRAAITTSGVGAVYDVFEIIVEPGVDLDGVTALDIQFQVHQALLAHRYLKNRMGDSAAANSDGSGQDTSKRRRSD